MRFIQIFILVCLLIVSTVQQSPWPTTYAFKGGYLRNNIDQPNYYQWGVKNFSFADCEAQMKFNYGQVMQYCDFGNSISTCNVWEFVNWSQFVDNGNVGIASSLCYLYTIASGKCFSLSEAVPNAWCKDYCTFNFDGSCNGVDQDMTSICTCADDTKIESINYCQSLNIAVPDSWCKSYCHIVPMGVEGYGTCYVDQHMSKICACK